jgi:predicted ATP-grasp superfamily ATP-dependent carboligase
VKILVTDGTYTNSLAIIRDLGKQNDIGISSHISKALNLCYYSKYAKKFHKIQSFKNSIDEYAEELLSIIERDHYDLIIPVGLESYLAASKYKDQFLKKTRLAVADWKSMCVAYQRDLALNLAESLEIPVPKYFKIETEKDIDRVYEYPIVFKHVGYGNDFVKYCNNLQETKNCMSQAGTLNTTIIQEYIQGFGCGFYGVYDRGKLMSHFMHKRIQEFPVNGGISAVAESYYDRILFNYGNRLCTALNWHGPIMVEFKYDVVHKDYKLIEINPKLWGSLDLTIGAGIDVPGLLVDLAFNRRISGRDYNQIRYHWIFPNQFKAMISAPTFGKSVYFIRSPFTGKTNLNFKDPLPTIYQILVGVMEGMEIIMDSKARYPHGRIKNHG